jgi:hypothetical protein
MNNLLQRITLAMLGVLMLLAVAPIQAEAQSLLTASVDRTAITTDDTITLSVVVNSQDVGASQPQLPALDGFNVVGTNTSTQINMINGAVSASVAYDYRLQPTRVGDLVIGEIVAAIDGATYATAPIAVHVTQGTGRPSSGAASAPALPTGTLGQSDYYLDAAVDIADPYVGQQLVYTLRFFEAADSQMMPSLFGGQPSYVAPTFTGFWSERESNQKSYRASVGGRIYTVTELKTVLVPTAAGSVTIDPAQIILPDSPFQRGGALQTDAVSVEVKPLPAGAPAGYSGGVGRFAIETALDTTVTDTDAPVTLKVTVVGQGNVSTTGDPAMPALDGWRVFPGKAAVETTVKDGVLYGQRIYEHVLAPTTTGDLAIPAFDYAYFDPTDDAYHVATSAPLSVQVSQGATPLVQASAPISATESSDADSAAVVLALKPLNTSLTLNAAPLTQQPWYWALWGLPLAILSGGFVWQKRQAHLNRNASAIRSSRAGKHARKALDRARKLTDGAAKALAVQATLLDYLSSKLHRSIAGLPQAEVVSLLTAQGVSATLAQRVLGCLGQAEELRFSPVAAENSAVDALLNNVAETIAALDAVLV